MTGLARWLALPGIAGLSLGILREQTGLMLLSLSLLVWLLVEWLLFTWRLWFELRHLKFERSVNGRTEDSGILWAGRSVAVEVRVSSSFFGMGSIVRIRDVVPENMQVLDQANDVTIRSRIHSAVFRYRAIVLGAGTLRLPGFRIVMHDRQGFFKAERFIPLTQNFRVLPAFQQVGDPQPIVKRINSQPQHGIHRLQRSGMGSYGIVPPVRGGTETQPEAPCQTPWGYKPTELFGRRVPALGAPSRKKAVTRTQERRPVRGGVPEWLRSVARCGRLAARVRRRAEVRLVLRVALREELVSFLVLDRREDDHVFAGLPVRGGRDLVSIRELERVDDAQDLVEVAARRCRVGQREADDALRVDDEHRAHGRRRALALDHVVQGRDLAVGVREQREVECRALRLLDVADPLLVRFEPVHAEADRLHVALVELRLEVRDLTELRGADGREVSGVREEDHPRVALPVGEVDGPLGGVLGEVRGGVAQSDGHVSPCRC